MEIAEIEAGSRRLAWRMAILAFLSQSMTIGCVYGTYGVVLVAVEARTGASRELTSLGLPLVALSGALTSLAAGPLAARMSIRLLMAMGAVLGIGGFALLAVSSSISMFLVAYGLLLGPAMGLTASVLPSVLISRWFGSDRGRALGFLHMPLMTMILPVPLAYLLKSQGLIAVYGVLVGLMVLGLLVTLLIKERPPGAAAMADKATQEAGLGEHWTIGRIAAQPWFWGLVLSLSMLISAGVSMAIHIVAMARQWGIGETAAASLVAISPLAGMAGSIVSGWIADKIGGRLTLAIACVNCAILWALMLLEPPYILLAPIVGLLGLNISCAMPAFALTTSRQFGPVGFGRAFGLTMFVVMLVPLAIGPLTAMLYVRTGSYTPLVAAHVGLMLFGALGILVPMPKPK